MRNHNIINNNESVISLIIVREKESQSSCESKFPPLLTGPVFLSRMNDWLPICVNRLCLSLSCFNIAPVSGVEEFEWPAQSSDLKPGWIGNLAYRANAWWGGAPLGLV